MKRLLAVLFLLGSVPAHAFDWVVQVHSHNVNKPPYEHGWTKLEHTRSSLNGKTYLPSPSGWLCYLEVDPSNQMGTAFRQFADPRGTRLHLRRPGLRALELQSAPPDRSRRYRWRSSAPASWTSGCARWPLLRTTRGKASN